MNIINPFLFINPREKEKIVGKKKFLKDLEKTIKKSLKTRKSEIIVLQGDVGMGKTLFIEKVLKDFKKEKILEIDFNMNTLNILRGLLGNKKKNMIIIDRLELIGSLTPKLQEKIVGLIIDLSRAGINFILSADKETISLMKGKNKELDKHLIVIKVPKLTYEEAREIIVSRLNENRVKKNNSLEPFTDEEIREVYNQSGGNPRMVLLLCASLFEQKF